MDKNIGADIILADDWLVKWDFHPRSEIWLPMAEAAMIQVSELVQGDRYPVLVRMNANSIERSARQYYQEKSPAYFSCAALLVSSPMSRILASIFLGLNKPPFPIKMFRDEKAAIAWLRETSSRLNKL